MATLSIENFPEHLLEKLQGRAERTRCSVGEEAIRILEESLGSEKKHSILELEGLGKELWEGIDAAEYIRTERDSWEP